MPDVGERIWWDDVSLCTYRVTSADEHSRTVLQLFYIPHQPYVVATTPIDLLPSTTLLAVLNQTHCQKAPPQLPTTNITNFQLHVHTHTRTHTTNNNTKSKG